MGHEPTTIGRSGIDWRAITLAIIAVLGVAMAAGLVLQQNNAARDRDAALRLQSSSYEVIILAHNLSDTMARAEAALGRHVISPQAESLQDYTDDWSAAGALLEDLTRQIANDPTHQAGLRELRNAYRGRGDELTGVARANNPALGMALYNAARGSPALERLDLALAGVIARERGLLDARSQAAIESLAKANATARALTWAIIPLALVAGLLGWVAVRNVRALGEVRAERRRSRELENAVEAATAELKQEAHERAVAESQLRQAQKMEAVGQLTGGIAHDFNNMLAVVVGGLELAQRQLSAGRPGAELHIENALDGANRAAALTRRLLAFARAEPLRPEAVAPNALVDGMSDLLNRTLGETIEIVTTDADRDWRVWIDPHQLENAILNLAVNARDAMDGRGTITIRTDGRTLRANEVGECSAGDYVTIDVQDNGHGMKPEVIERAFEPFFTTKPVGQGTGLGLSQIFGFVRQSHGAIDIYSVPDMGTTVTLFLPRHIVAAAEATEPSAAPRVEPRSTPHSALDILVVEDDPRVLSATLGALTELGHRPVACADPAAAPALLDQVEALDLIMTDVMMPGQTGPEMIAALKPRLGNVAVLFVTGYAGDVTDTAQFGGHPVLRKPFTIAALERAIGEATTHRGLAAAE